MEEKKYEDFQGKVLCFFTAGVVFYLSFNDPKQDSLFIEISFSSKFPNFFYHYFFCTSPHCSIYSKKSLFDTLKNFKKNNNLTIINQKQPKIIRKNNLKRNRGENC